MDRESNIDQSSSRFAVVAEVRLTCRMGERVSLSRMFGVAARRSGILFAYAKGMDVSVLNTILRIR